MWILTPLLRRQRDSYLCSLRSQMATAVFLFVACFASAASGSGASALPPFGHGLRPFFFYPDNFTQLNHGAYGGTTRDIVAAQYAAVAEMESNLDNFMNGATGYRACILAARATAAELLGANVSDVVLVDNASEGINAILRNFEPPLSADEWILDLSTAYGPFAAFYEWLGIRQGVQTLTVPIVFPVTGPASFIEPVRAVLAANASSLNIRVAVISLISAYPAVTLPVAELVALLHGAGIPVVIDAAHAIGNIPMNVQALGDPEYLMTNLHKFYFAPKSAAALYVRQDRQLPHVPAPAVVDSVETQAFTDRFIWTGTRDRTAYCAVQAATAFRAALGGEAAVQAYNAGIALFAKQHLETVWQVPPMAPDSMMSSLSIVQLPTLNATVCGILRGALIDEYGLGISGWTALPGIPCYLRISGQVYLENSDIIRLGDAVIAILKGLGEPTGLLPPQPRLPTSGGIAASAVDAEVVGRGK